MSDPTTHPSLTKFADKEYRDAYLEATVRSGVAAQMHALRGDMSQAEFAAATDKKQSTISRLENPEYLPSIQSLLDIAKARSVALLVKFVSYPEFFEQTADMSPAALQPETIIDTIASAVPSVNPNLLNALAANYTGQAKIMDYASQMEHPRKRPPQPTLTDQWFSRLPEMAQ